MQKGDLRVQRTQFLIVDAFEKLLKEKPFEKITVQNIADKAMINRKTYYTYFYCRSELLEAVCANCFNNLADALARFEPLEQKNPESFKHALISVLKTVDGYSGVYEALLEKYPSPDFEENIYSILQEYAKSRLKYKTGGTESAAQAADLRSAFFSSGFLKILRLYAKGTYNNGSVAEAMIPFLYGGAL